MNSLSRVNNRLKEVYNNPTPEVKIYSVFFVVNNIALTLHARNYFKGNYEGAQGKVVKIILATTIILMCICFVLILTSGVREKDKEEDIIDES